MIFVFVALIFILLFVQLVSTVLYLDDFYFTSKYLADLPVAPKSNPLHEMTWGSDWKRQLLIHPPLLTIFYWVWVRIIGSSETLIHIPSAFATLIACYYWWKITLTIRPAWKEHWGLWIMLWCSSFPILINACQAIYAPFECAYLGFAIYRLHSTHTPIYQRLFINIIGVGLFYLYLFYWLIDLLYQYRSHPRIDRILNFMLFLCVSATCLFWYIRNALSHLYAWDHWISPTFQSLLTIFTSLPYVVYI